MSNLFTNLFTNKKQLKIALIEVVFKTWLIEAPPILPSTQLGSYPLDASTLIHSKCIVPKGVLNNNCILAWHLQCS